MRIEEVIKELNKINFSLEYNYNVNDWALTIYDEELGIKDTLEEYLYLKNLIKAYLGVELTDFKEFDRIENQNITISLNYNNRDNSENFYRIETSIEINGRYEEWEEYQKIKSLDEFIEVLANMEDIVDREILNASDYAEYKKDPDEYYGVSVKDFFDENILNRW